MEDNSTSGASDHSETLNIIHTRKEYVESLVNDFGSGAVSYEKLLGELAQEIRTLYAVVESLITNLNQAKGNYEFLFDIIVSMPEVQRNTSLAQKIKERFPEDSHP